MDSSSEKQASPSDFRFEVHITADGSPTLSLPQQNSEFMHHREGALTESLYIYGEAMDLVQTPEYAVLSVGLGLGYNEIIAAAKAMKQNRPLRLLSFEVEEALRSNFIDWLTETSDSDWTKTYDQILNSIADHFFLNATELKKLLVNLYKNKLFLIEGPLTKGSHFADKYNCIFFDAFSNNTSPELWDEGFLVSFLKECAEKHCILTTYAATGNLNRALKKNDFVRKARTGFSGKRQSTLAVR